VSGIRRGMSGAEIIGALQKSDLWYKAEDYGSDFRYWREAWEKGTKMQFSWRQEVLNPDLYVQTTWQMSARWETVCRVEWHDPITGEDYTDYVTITHTHEEDGLEVPDRLQTLTRGEIEEAAEEAMGPESKGIAGVVRRVTPMMGFYNPEVGLWG